MTHDVTLLGAGYMARVHATAWGRIGARVATVCSPGDSGRRLADELGASWTGSLDAALSSTGIADICTPTGAHVSLVEAALGAGVHVLVEKPLALDRDGLERVAVAVSRRRPGQVVMIAHVVQFFAGYRRLIDDVAAGAIGATQTVLATRFSSRPDWAAWLTDESASGGPLADFLVHDFDIANSVLGEPMRVSASVREAQYSVAIDYPAGSAVVIGGQAMPEGTPLTSTLQINGSDGILSHRFAADAADGPPSSTTTLTTASGDETLRLVNTDPFVEELRYFLGCVVDGREPRYGSVSSAIRACLVSLAARDSVRSGRPTMVGEL